MKTTYLILFTILLTTFAANSQGTLIYDQQSATSPGGNNAFQITEDQPVGQAFTPSLSSVGFIQLELFDGQPGNDLGATVFLNLWSGSISNGTLLASTEPIFMPDSFGVLSYGALTLVSTNFIFQTPVSVTPGNTYYIQPIVIQPGSDDPWDVISGLFNYAGGPAYVHGNPAQVLTESGPIPGNYDLWFREGIIAVPEPSSSLLVLLGAPVLIYIYLKQRRSPLKP